MDDQQFLKFLHRFGLSRKGYRRVRKGVKKRIRRHMQQLRCHTLEEYFLALDKNRELRLQCELLTTVSISRFFRDRGLWQALENQILPRIIEGNRKRVRVWSAGCACGEEVYSFKILWERLRSQFESLPALEVLATDINPLYLHKARTGIYSLSSLKELQEEVRLTHFQHQRGKGKYKVNPSLKGGILWKEHNLLTDPAGTDFHLIFLRNNLLTYYEGELKEPAFRKIADSLVPEGFLIIGSHEEIPLKSPDLISSHRHPYIFRNRPRAQV